MQKKLDKTTVEFQMFQDYWKLVQFYWIPEKDDYWTNLVKSCEGFIKKYNNSLFAERLTDAFMKAKEQEWRDKNGL